VKNQVNPFVVRKLAWINRNIHSSYVLSSEMCSPLV